MKSLSTSINTQTPTLDFIEVLTPLLSRLGFEEGFFTNEEEEEAAEDDFFPPAEGIAPLEEDDDDDEEDFILLISTIKALARFLTMASRSGCSDLLSRESRQTEVEISYKI